MANNMRSWKKRSCLPKIFLILLFFSIGFIFIEIRISPVLICLADEKIHALALTSIQNTVKEEINRHTEYQNYDQLVHMERDNNGYITLLMPNTMKINVLVADITTAVQQNISDIGKQDFSIPFGAVSGSTIFAFWGPKIPVSVEPVGIVNVHLTDDFISAGINQTRHRLWLNIETDLSIAIPLEKDKQSIKTEVLLTEGIIVGPIPDTYLDFNSDTSLQ